MKQAQGNGCDCAGNHPSYAPDQDGGGDHGQRAEVDNSSSPKDTKEDPAFLGCCVDPDPWGKSECGINSESYLNANKLIIKEQAR